jgi:lipoprotein NlpI
LLETEISARRISTVFIRLLLGSKKIAEGRADIAVRDAEIMARMRQDYGIDPLGSSWLHLAEQHVEEKKAA